MSMPTAEIRRWRFSTPLVSGANPPFMVEGNIYKDSMGVNLDGDYVKIGSLSNVEDKGTHLDVFTTGGFKYRLFKDQEQGYTPRPASCEVHGVKGCPTCQ